MMDVHGKGPCSHPEVNVAERDDSGPVLRNAEELRHFFEASDRAHGTEAGPEAYWEEHLRVLVRGKVEGGGRGVDDRGPGG